MRSRTRFLAAVLAAVVLTSVFAVAPARPAGAIDVLPTPPGWGVGGGGSGGGKTPGGQLTVDCPRGSAFYDGKLAYVAWPGCETFEWAGRRYSWEWSDDRRWCSHAYEVWRFYGTVDNPTRIRTTQRVNLDPCANIPTLVNEDHPEDSARSANIGVRAPYRLAGAQFERRWPTSVSALYTGGQFRSFAFTTWPAFRRDGGSCHTLMGKDPELSRYFYRGDRYDPSATVYRLRMDSWGRAFNAWGLTWADTVFEVTGWGPNQQMIVGDNGLDCSGPSDFAVPAKRDANGNQLPPMSQADVRISGYCAVPVWREHRRFTSRAGGEWYEPILPNVIPGQGSREVYYPFFSPAGLDRNTLRFSPGSTSARAAAYPNVLNAMRWSVVTEVSSRTANSVVTPSKEGSWLPPQGSRGNDDAAWAGLVAASYSHCDFSTGERYPDGGGTTDEGSSSTSLPGDAVRVVVSVPEAGQSGGANRPETTISTRLASGPGGATVLCGPPGTTTYCPTTANGPFLQDLDLAVTLTPPDGGQYKVRTPYTADNAGRGTLGLEFYLPTDGDQTYQVAVTGTAVIRGWEGSTTSRTVCDPSSLGGACREVSGNTRRLVERPVRVEVVYERGGLTPADRFPVVGATATPTEDRQ